MTPRAGLLLSAALLIAGCSSVYLQHPQTGHVNECEPFKAGMGLSAWIDRKLCINRWEKKGYVLVETTQAIKNKARSDARNDEIRSRSTPIEE
jgi:hypothetical protein